MIDRFKYLFVFAIIYCGLSVFPQGSCTIEIPANQSEVFGNEINPGDVICLLAGDKDHLTLRNIQGTENNPVTIRNKGGIVEINTDHYYGIKFDNCKHIVFTGSGVNNTDYGIVVSRVGNGAGMSIDNMSTNIEVSHVEISYTSIGGIYAKTEPYQGDCNNLITRDKFTMYDLSIHDCYLHDIADEGFYVGSSKYTGQTIYQCDEIVVLPHVIEGVEIFNNIVENTGWDGIQVSSASKDCNIWNNEVINDSYAEELFQMSGIIIGGGSKCDCYNNTIIDGKGDGIDVFGMGNMKIYNNLIVNAGRTFKPNDPGETKSGIYVGSVPDAFTPGANFKLYNNTIVSPKSNGIDYNNSVASVGYITNNLITNPGAGGDYIKVRNNSVVEKSNNFLSDNNSNPKFINQQSGNYDLKPGSPAVNYGTSLTAEGITFDILNRPRPFHTYFDAGAFECHDPTAGIEDNFDKQIEVYPNPASSMLTITFSTQPAYPVYVKLISLDGRIISLADLNEKREDSEEIHLPLDKMATGNYILQVNNKDLNFSTPIVINTK